MSEFKNMKFRVNSEEESKIIQKLLFEMGYKWYKWLCCEEKEMRHHNTDRPFLYASDKGRISFDDREVNFLDSPYKEFVVKYTLVIAPKKHKTITIAGKKYDEELVKYLLEDNSVPCIEGDDE